MLVVRMKKEGPEKEQVIKEKLKFGKKKKQTNTKPKDKTVHYGGTSADKK